MNTPILPPLPEASNDNRKYGRAGFHSNNSPAYTAEQMNAHYIKGYNDAIAAIRTQGVPDGFALQIEASVTQAQKVLSDWNEWYGLNGGNAPLPPSGIVKAQEMLAEVRSLLASAQPAPQQKPLTDEQIEAIYTQETGSLIDDSPWALVDFARAIEAAHNIGEKK